MRTRRVIIVAIALAILAVAALVFGSSAAKRRAESISCGNYVVAIMCAARMWSNDHNERLPPDLLNMSNELNSPKILHCPGDHARERVRIFSEFTEAHSSYEVLAPGALEWNTNTVFLRCKVHGHLGYTDGTVFDGKRRRRKDLF